MNVTQAQLLLKTQDFMAAVEAVPPPTPHISAGPCLHSPSGFVPKYLVDLTPAPICRKTKQ